MRFPYTLTHRAPSVGTTLASASWWLRVFGAMVGWLFTLYLVGTFSSAWMARAQAASLYLLCYYGGSSVIGWLGGLVYGQGGWPAMVVMIAGLVLLALVAAARLATIAAVETDRPGLAAP